MHSYGGISLHMCYFKTDVQVHRPTNRYFLRAPKTRHLIKRGCLFACHQRATGRGLTRCFPLIPTDSIDPQTVDSANRSKKGSVCGNGTLFSREPGCPVALFGSSIGEAQTEGWWYWLLWKTEGRCRLLVWKKHKLWLKMPFNTQIKS